MSAAAWLPVILEAVEFAVRQARALGMPPLDQGDVKKLIGALEVKLNEVLPIAIVGVALGAVAAAVKAEAEINSLGTSPTCPQCGGVATQHVAHSPHTGQSEVTLSCDACGWRST